MVNTEYVYIHIYIYLKRWITYSHGSSTLCVKAICHLIPMGWTSGNRSKTFGKSMGINERILKYGGTISLSIPYFWPYALWGYSLKFRP